MIASSTAPAPRAGPGAWSPARPAAVVGLGSVLAVGLAAAVGSLAPSTGAAGPALLVLAGLAGLPHGAVDHLALGWSQGSRHRPPRRVLAAYAGAAVGVAAAALAAPVPALLALLVLSAAHFAEGEVAFDRLRGGPALRLPAVALGVAVVALPLLLRPGQVQPLLTALDPSLPSVLAVTRTPVLVATAVLVVVGLLVAVTAGALRLAAELALVVTASLVAPPLLVFAAWFGAWHAPRHLVRLLALQPDGDLRTRGARLARGAAAPTAVVVVGLGALAAGGHGLPAALLVVLLSLTVPHAAVVARLGPRAGTPRLRPAAPRAGRRARA